MPDTSIFNQEKLNELLEISDGDFSLIRDLLEKFISSTTELLAASDKGMIENDYKKIIFCMHSIKGASANLGISEMTEFAKSLEMAGKEENQAFIRQNFSLLVNPFEKVKKFYVKL